MSDAAELIATIDALARRAERTPTMVGDALLRLEGHLEGEQRPEVLIAVADALGRLWDPRALPTLAELTASVDPTVRRAAAMALHGACAGQSTLGAAGPLLVRLMADADERTRDWATFALSESAADDESVRAALWDRIAADDGDAAGEAMVGLARRKDPSIAECLLARLQSSPGNLVVEAAAELGDPCLYPALLKLRDDGWASRDPRPDTLAEALRACAPDQDESHPRA